jgi:predicted GNAT family N-acyltransferase
MIFRVAKSAKEGAEAYAFALKIFQAQAALPKYSAFKSMLWKADPTAAPKNLILMRSVDGRLIGMARIVPRALFRGGQKLSVAGLSTICLAPDYRGKGLSLPLMRYTLSICQDRGYDIALLFARRAADHYYGQFGFWGVSSYNKAHLKKSQAKPQPLLQKYTLAPCQARLIPLYQKAYARCYGKSFGRFERTKAYWSFLMQRMSYLKGSKFQTILQAGKPIGYVVTEGDHVQELAYTGPFAWDSLSGALRGFSVPPELTLQIPAEHRLLSELTDTDCTLSFRECLYGGHMVKVLNGGSTGRLSYDATLKSLRIHSLNRIRVTTNPSYTFNVSPIDEF